MGQIKVKLNDDDKLKAMEALKEMDLPCLPQFKCL